MNIVVDRKFQDWAKAWSGCNGGNVNADLWVCGLEFGTGHKKPFLDRRHERHHVDGVPAWTPGFLAEFGDQVEASAYIRKLAKVILAFRGQPIGDYKTFRMGRMLRSDGQAFHLNLYPLSFRSSGADLWSKEHYELTGLPNKVIYRAWCMEHRFPWLAQHLREAGPKVLLCTGTSFREDFLCAFSADPFADKTPRTLPSGKVVEERLINQGRTRLLISPFLGQGGIMSNADLTALGELCRS